MVGLDGTRSGSRQGSGRASADVSAAIVAELRTNEFAHFTDPELPDLVKVDMGHRRDFGWINHHIHNDGALGGYSLCDGLAQRLRLRDAKTLSTAGLGEHCEIRVFENRTLGKYRQSSLLHFEMDESPTGIVKHEHFHRQPVLHRGNKLLHQHGEAPIAAHGDHLAMGIEGLYAVRHTECYSNRRVVKRPGDLLPASGSQPICSPERHLAGVDTENRILGREIANRSSERLRMYAVFAAGEIRLFIQHTLPRCPVLLGRTQETIVTLGLHSLKQPGNAGST